MTDGLEALPQRVERIEQKLTAFGQRVDTGFREVTDALVEQRQYTEFAFDRLRREMVAGFERVEGRIDHLEGKVDRLEGKVDQVILLITPRRPTRSKKR